jgi:hypothetical protein
MPAPAPCLRPATRIPEQAGPDVDSNATDPSRAISAWRHHLIAGARSGVTAAAGDSNVAITPRDYRSPHPPARSQFRCPGLNHRYARHVRRSQRGHPAHCPQLIVRPDLRTRRRSVHIVSVIVSRISAQPYSRWSPIVPAARHPTRSARSAVAACGAIVVDVGGLSV